MAQGSALQLPVVPSSATVTGHTLAFDSDGDNTAQSVKASAGSLYGFHIINTNTSVAYLQLFNTATGSVTVGTTTPVAVFMIPAQDYFSLPLGTTPISFSTAITYACTTTPTGNGDPTTGLTCTFFYK